MKKFLLPLSLICALNMASVPAQAAVITLKDGSKINGDVVGMENGSYVINTPGMGKIYTSHQNVTSIVAGAETTPTTATTTPSNGNVTSLPEYRSIQNKIVNNPEAMSDIQKMAEDPEIMALMSDPSFIAAIQSGNINALQSDPRLQRLSQNPKIQALMHKIQP